MTKLLYLDDTYLKSCQAEILEIVKNEEIIAIVLDRTCFYPQGGGQKSDTGYINNQYVHDVRLQADGKVYHYVLKSENLSVGDTVNLEINLDQRIKNSRLHSAGHLIAQTVEKLYPELIGSKGHHYEGEAYVGINGQITEPDKALVEIEAAVNNLVLTDAKIKSYMASKDQIQTLNLYAPEGKDVRLVEIEGFAPIGCGGTHVNSLNEIGEIKIKKIKHKKGLTKISYTL